MLCCCVSVVAAVLTSVVIIHYVSKWTTNYVHHLIRKNRWVPICYLITILFIVYDCWIVQLCLSSNNFLLWFSIEFGLLNQIKQGVTLMRRNCTGPPWSVGCPTAHSPSGRLANCPCSRRADRPVAGRSASFITDDDDNR